jgi:Ca2+-binding RTX toxin-like protein
MTAYFFSSETKNVNVYGLDGNDIFSLEGNTNSPVLVRVLGGKGNDVIRNAMGEEISKKKDEAL